MTNEPYKIMVKDYHFNSHAHVERDQSKFYDSKVTYDFNSHAHVERDIRKKYPMQPFTNFNSHAHVERDFAFTPIEL